MKILDCVAKSLKKMGADCKKHPVSFIATTIFTGVATCMQYKSISTSLYPEITGPGGQFNELFKYYSDLVEEPHNTLKPMKDEHIFDKIESSNDPISKSIKKKVNEKCPETVGYREAWAKYNEEHDLYATDDPFDSSHFEKTLEDCYAMYEFDMLRIKRQNQMLEVIVNTICSIGAVLTIFYKAIVKGFAQAIGMRISAWLKSRIGIKPVVQCTV